MESESVKLRHYQFDRDAALKVLPTNVLLAVWKMLVVGSDRVTGRAVNVVSARSVKSCDEGRQKQRDAGVRMTRSFRVSARAVAIVAAAIVCVGAATLSA